MRLSDRVHLLLSGDLGCSLSHPADCNAYALRCGQEKYLIIDSGAGADTESIVSQMEKDGIASEQVGFLLLTHAHLDHSGGAHWMQQRFGLEVLASSEAGRAIERGDEKAIGLASAKKAGIYSQDAKLQSCKVSSFLDGGESWKIGDITVTAIPTPGHSDDSITYLIQTSNELLAFPGDAVFHGGRILMQDLPDCRPHAQAESLRSLAALPIDGLFPGHGIWSLKRGAEQIHKSLQQLDRLLMPTNLL